MMMMMMMGMGRSKFKLVTLLSSLLSLNPSMSRSSLIICRDTQFGLEDPC